MLHFRSLRTAGTGLEETNIQQKKLLFLLPKTVHKISAASPADAQ